MGKKDCCCERYLRKNKKKACKDCPLMSRLSKKERKRAIKRARKTGKPAEIAA